MNTVCKALFCYLIGAGIGAQLVSTIIGSMEGSAISLGCFGIAYLGQCIIHSKENHND